MNNKVCIILINYNNWADTLECLESLFRLDYDYFRVIVVDNASSNDSLHKIDSWAKGELPVKMPESGISGDVEPNVIKPIKYDLLEYDDDFAGETTRSRLTVIRSSKNRGYAGGNNIGLKFALLNNDFDYAWLLNNDTVAEKNTLSNFIHYQENTSVRSGIFGSMVMRYDNTTKIESLKRLYIPYLGLEINIDTLENNLPATSRIEKIGNFAVSFPSGASLFVRKEFIRDVGLLNEAYFLYFEELDWLERGRQKGWEWESAVNTRVWHKGSSSTGSKNNYTSELSDFSRIRSQILFSKSYYPKSLFVLYPVFCTFTLFNRLKRRQANRIYPILKILLDPAPAVYQTRGRTFCTCPNEG